MLTGVENLTLVVYAGDPLPQGPSVFLAGPTPRSEDVPSWRPDAIRELGAQWGGPGRLAVVIPEPSGRPWPYHDNQAEWETAGREGPPRSCSGSRVTCGRCRVTALTATPGGPPKGTPSSSRM